MFSHAHGSSFSSIVPCVGSSHPTIAPLTSDPMHLLGSLMVPTWKNIKHLAFELHVLLMVPRPILYGKEKGAHGSSSMSQPSWPSTTPTSKVE